MKDEALRLALDKKADNARDLGLNYDPENTLHWHALNYRTAPTQNAQEMFEALEKFVETAIKQALEQPEPEPVAWVDMAYARLGMVRDKMHPDDVATVQRFLEGDYTSPPKHEPEPVIDKSAAIRIATSLGWTPKREWQELTNVDVSKILDDQNGFYTFEKCFNFAKAIEAKLKEKNHDSR